MRPAVPVTYCSGLELARFYLGFVNGGGRGCMAALFFRS